MIMGHVRSMSNDARRIRNMETLQTYFRLLEGRNIDAWITLWAEDCSIIAPYATGDIPKMINGKSSVYSFYREQAASYVALRFAGTEIYPFHDPDKVLARWYPRGELHGGYIYTNENIGVFEFNGEGSITRFFEYFNPVGVLEKSNISG